MIEYRLKIQQVANPMLIKDPSFLFNQFAMNAIQLRKILKVISNLRDFNEPRIYNVLVHLSSFTEVT